MRGSTGQDLVDCRHALVDRHVQHELRTHAPVLLSAAAAETLVLPPHFDDDVFPCLLARCEDDLHTAVAGWHDLVAEAVELLHSLDLLDTLQRLLRVNPLLLDLEATKDNIQRIMCRRPSIQRTAQLQLDKPIRDSRNRLSDSRTRVESVLGFPEDLPLFLQTDLDAADRPGAAGREAQSLWR